ncbi:MAG: hypothetical protein K2X82_27440 [Gemmataceae bacterium]|nr:hypothetical protein [Gemmataceae bacterium]
MARPAKHTHTLPNGRVVGYGLTTRGGSYRVRFEGPDGTRWEQATGSDRKADARTAAGRIINEAYTPPEAPPPQTTTWDTAVAELGQTPGLRPDTLRNYRTVIRVFRSLIPAPTGPGDVTVADATRFKRLYLSTPTARGRRPRTPVSCRTYLRSLRSLWAKHFRELGYVGSNPWAEVSYPDVDKKDVVIPEEESFRAFFKWLDAKYPGWPLIRLFVRVKGLTACRTLDLCQLRPEHLAGGKLVLTPDITKTKRGRVVPLPADVFAGLKAIAGKKHLWERYTADAKVHRPGPRNRDEFDPKTLYWAVSAIFREYNAAHPAARVKPHDLRKRGITLTTLATQSVDATAHALGLDPQTARRYYTDATRAFDADALLTKMAAVLDPASPANSAPRPSAGGDSE